MFFILLNITQLSFVRTIKNIKKMKSPIQRAAPVVFIKSEGTQIFLFFRNGVRSVISSGINPLLNNHNNNYNNNHKKSISVQRLL